MITMTTITMAIRPSTIWVPSHRREAGPISSRRCVRGGPGCQVCSGSGDSVGRGGSGAGTTSDTGYLRGVISAAQFTTDRTAASC
jgi:hypothetical protein